MDGDYAHLDCMSLQFPAEREHTEGHVYVR